VPLLEVLKGSSGVHGTSQGQGWGGCVEGVVRHETHARPGTITNQETRARKSCNTILSSIKLYGPTVWQS
jgi:hypothetical protein